MRAPLKLALGGLIAILVGGCGSGSPGAPAGTSTDAAASAKPKPTAARSKGPCQPLRFAGEVDPPAGRRGVGDVVPIQIGTTDASVEVLRAASPRSVKIVYGVDREFEAPAGSTLVAVDYRLRNRGPGEVQPAADFNGRVLLKAGEIFYPYSAAVPCDIPITASWASAHGGSNPAFRIPVGGSTRSSVVFVIPRQARTQDVSLIVPGQVGIELGALRP